MVGGTLVYNEIVVLPIDFMKRNTREEIAKRENKRKGILDEDNYPTKALNQNGQDPNYVALSPGAVYDS